MVCMEPSGSQLSKLLVPGWFHSDTLTSTAHQRSLLWIWHFFVYFDTHYNQAMLLFHTSRLYQSPFWDVWNTQVCYTRSPVWDVWNTSLLYEISILRCKKHKSVIRDFPYLMYETQISYTRSLICSEWNTNQLYEISRRWCMKHKSVAVRIPISVASYKYGVPEKCCTYLSNSVLISNNNLEETNIKNCYILWIAGLELYTLRSTAMLLILLLLN